MLDSNKRDRFLKLIDFRLKASFEKVKEELDEHLQSINEGSGEIQNVQDNLAEVESKIDKLDSRVEELQLMISDLTKTDVDLKADEQKVFLALYMYESKTPLSYSDIARKTNLEELEVKSVMACLMTKGVELIHEVVDGKLYFRLHPDFKELQAKESVITIDEDVKSELMNSSLNSYFS
ncbi:hypothetical protein HN419_07280 [Candidatus Woesearchaeota archaeon]|nr:hypothetical protein [Candidatus Woesearchaeota archaeon]MBT3538295.1 hypothetical protein [Candidatus Woesearchaeota archaeon]MBT4696711.1 hypothetical protein [Candidatus Woesearchaeota archaeon]MBT4716829.1 hypothetical protein [Candidatus Woesearchaeota archaeon]MBT7105964.1 hypothetical protein [Candidatus Woesearchaeota archaeon]